MRFFSRPADLEACATSPSPPTTNRPTPGPAVPTPPDSPPASTLPTPPITKLPSHLSDPLASYPSTSRRATTYSAPAVSSDTEKLRELLEKYDPRSMNVHELWPMSKHRDMIRTMFLDNILYATARLHRHNWILEAGNELYRGLCGKERWDLIHEDLERYTKAIKDYQFWLTCFIQKQELERNALPPTYHFYGRTLALLELASHPLTSPTLNSNERALLLSIEHSFVAENHTWSQANAIARHERFKKLGQYAKRKGLINRILMATFGGSTLIIPMLIMTLDTRLVTTLLTTSVFTLGIGLILAFWMDNADSKDIIGATAAYAAVLVVFVGTGNGMGK